MVSCSNFLLFCFVILFVKTCKSFWYKKKKTFTGAATGEAFQINQKHNCEDKSLIYLLKCKFCENNILHRAGMHFDLGETVTRAMTKYFRKIKIAGNSIFMSILIAVIIDSCEMFPLWCFPRFRTTCTIQKTWKTPIKEWYFY